MAGVHQLLLASGGPFNLIISSNQTNANLRSLAIAAGWDQNSKLIATINSGIYISSNSTGTPALTIYGSFPGGVDLTNNGFIIGMGGAGGTSQTANMSTAPAAAGSGGPALSVSSPVRFTNTGTIAGGGGGGGGGASRFGTTTFIVASGGGGGGGRSGQANSAGGTAAIGSYQGANGNPGTVSGAGAGGSGGSSGSVWGGNGGNGGDWATAGAAGAASGGVQSGGVAGSAGAAGAAVSGNSNITWLATGTRLGAIT